MGELKQRRKGGDGKKKQPAEAASSTRQQQQAQARQPQANNEPFGRWKKYGMTVLLLCLYIPFIVVINPATIPSLYFRFIATPCQGVCNLVPKPSDCQVDTTNLVFMRIAKTGTTTILSILERGLKRKNVKIFDLHELEDVVSSLEVKGAALDRMGYHDPNLYQERIQEYYKRASKTMLYPPFRAQERNILEGHFVYFNFTKNAARLVGPEAKYVKYMPTWLKQHYHLERPKLPLELQQITILRHPQDRLKSMYYYDRHDARTSTWRDLLVKQQGNATLQQCLLNQTCIQKNKLRQWCSLQTESLCGIGKKCRPASTTSLELAKQNLEKFVWVGITEQMQDSLKLLQQLLPTYLEGVSLESAPRKKSSQHISRETSFSPKAQAVLDNLCALDNELYEYAKQVLQERMEECLPSS